MQWIVIEIADWFIKVDQRHVVLEVVENTLDGAVSVLRSERREADVLECDVCPVPRSVVVLHLHRGQVVLNVVHLREWARAILTERRYWNGNMSY